MSREILIQTKARVGSIFVKESPFHIHTFIIILPAKYFSMFPEQTV